MEVLLKTFIKSFFGKLSNKSHMGETKQNPHIHTHYTYTHKQTLTTPYCNEWNLISNLILAPIFFILDVKQTDEYKVCGNSESDRQSDSLKSDLLPG